MGNPAWRSDRHESGLGKPVIHGPGRRADSGDLLLVWLQEQLSLLVVAREAARSMEDGEAGVGIFVDLDAWTHPGKVEAPYTVCIASASNLTGLLKSSVECRRTGL